ncbi:hypothetical protein [Paenibacillus sp. A14]|uniref:hypothetical protein n=1 Tax=Paenibacillus sp. A14 TaxID=3119820 RepID=UPI002FDF7CF4
MLDRPEPARGSVAALQGNYGSPGWRSGWAPLAEGFVDFRRLLADLKSVRYDGYLGIEDFSGQYSSGALLPAFVQFIRERMGI